MRFKSTPAKRLAQGWLRLMAYDSDSKLFLSRILPQDKQGLQLNNEPRSMFETPTTSQLSYSVCSSRPVARYAFLF